jgi:hypothetical protein
MTAKKKAAAPPDDDQTDLLDEMAETEPGDIGGDLLDEMQDDDAEAWVPEEPGDGIQGVVIKRGTTRSDYDDDKVVPTMTIRVKSGECFRIVGYSSVLAREIIDQDPQPGDTVALKYFGEKTVKRGKFAGKPYKHTGLLVRKPVPEQAAA